MSGRKSDTYLNNCLELIVLQVFCAAANSKNFQTRDTFFENCDNSPVVHFGTLGKYWKTELQLKN